MMDYQQSDETPGNMNVIKQWIVPDASQTPNKWTKVEILMYILCTLALHHSLLHWQRIWSYQRWKSLKFFGQTHMDRRRDWCEGWYSNLDKANFYLSRGLKFSNTTNDISETFLQYFRVFRWLKFQHAIRIRENFHW